MMTTNEFLELQKQFDGTAAWNEAGYTGKGITVWDMEPLNAHGSGTRQRVLDAAPEVTVLNAPHNICTKDKTITSESVEYNNTSMSADLFIKRYNISVLSQSIAANGKLPVIYAPLYHQLRMENDLALFNSAGNDGEDYVGGRLPESEAMYVGACVAFGGNFDDLRMAYYSSVGTDYEVVDFSTFTRLGQAGTSFAAPYLAGIAALLKQRYGRYLRSEEIYQYFKMISRPILTNYKVDDKYDLKSGYGIPILPPVDKRFIRMTIGKTEYKVDDEVFTMDVAPIIEDERTFVPVAFVALALDAKVAWDKQDKSVAISKGDKLVQMWIGQKSYLINGKPYYMEVKPFIKNKRTLVPIAFIAEALGCKIGWVNNLKEVLILEG